MFQDGLPTILLVAETRFQRTMGCHLSEKPTPGQVDKFQSAGNAGIGGLTAVRCLNTRRSRPNPSNASKVP